LDAIDEVLGKKNPKLLPLNKQAFERGVEFANRNRVLLQEE